MGVFICVPENSTEERIKAMYKNDWKTKADDYKPVLKSIDTTADDEDQNDNFEELITDNISSASNPNSKGIRWKA